MSGRVAFSLGLPVTAAELLRTLPLVPPKAWRGIQSFLCILSQPVQPVGSGRGGAMGVQGKGGSLPSDTAPPPPQNFCSRAALEALGSCLNNKYSEGYPGKR